LAIKFAENNWIVAASARRENLLDEISENNENIHGFPLDVTDKSKCKEVFEQIKNKFQVLKFVFFQLELGIQKKKRILMLNNRRCI
jgi:short-subunit dehydrogenase involved in D-alanine esterification of teichoic acids